MVVNLREHQLMKVVQKIGIFSNLTHAEALTLLRASHYRTFEAGETIYTAGSASDEMLILVAGRLSVTSHSGDELAEIPAGGCIGEMGIFTGHPRSANIVAVGRSAGFTITKAEMVTALSANKDMLIKLLQNLVSLLSERLTAANLRLEKQEHDSGGSGDEDDEDDEDEEDDDELEDEEVDDDDHEDHELEDDDE